MQITGGKVTFGRSVQPAQYETKKAEVEITFTLAEGEALGDTLNHAASVAQDKALEMVGLKKAVSSNGTGTTTASQSSSGTTGGKEGYAAAQAAANAPKPEPAPARRGRPPNPDKPKPAAAPNINIQPENRVDPADMVDETVIDTDAMVDDPVAKAKAAVAAAQAAKDAADLAEMMGTEEPITDKVLIEKVGHKNKVLIDANKGIPQSRRIKELVGKYATHVHSIPADQRKAFLADLEALA